MKNNIGKVTLAVLGACNNVMGLFIPLAVALLFINVTILSAIQSSILLTIAIASTLFRAMKVWIE